MKFFYKSSSDTGNGVVFIMEEDTTIVETDQCNTLIYMKKMIAAEKMNIIDYPLSVENGMYRSAGDSGKMIWIS